MKREQILGCWLLFWSVIFCYQDEPICRKYKIFSINSEKSKEKLVNRVKTLIKEMGSLNERRQNIAYKYFRRLAPYAISYIKEIFPRLRRYSQIARVEGYYFLKDIDLNEVTDADIICKKGKHLLWYAVLNGKLLLVGSKTRIIDSYPILLKDWSINSFSCDFSNKSSVDYAIEIFVWERFKSRRIVISSYGIYKDVQLKSADKQYFILLRKEKNEAKKYCELRGEWYSGFLCVKSLIINGRETPIFENIFIAEFDKYRKQWWWVAKKADTYLLFRNHKLVDTSTLYFFPTFTSDFKHFAYHKPSGDKVVVVVDGKILGVYDEVSQFGFVNNKISFKARNNEKWFFVWGEKKTPQYDFLYNVYFNNSKSDFAYVAFLEGKYRVYYKDWKSDGYDGIAGVNFSDDDANIFFIANKGLKWVGVTSTDWESKEYNFILPQSVIFEKNNNEIWFVAQKTDELTGKNVYVIVHNGKESKPYDIVLPKFVASKDGIKRYFFASNEGRLIVILEDRELVSLPITIDPNDYYSSLRLFTVSPDGENYAFVVREGRKGSPERIVVNGKVSKQYEEVYDIAFSNKGNRLLYHVKDGKYEFVVVDGVESKRYDRIRGLKVNNFGEGYSYIATTIRKNRGFERLVLNGREGKKYNSLYTFSFLPDGKSYYYIATDGVGNPFVHGFFRMIINGKKSKRYNRILNRDATGISDYYLDILSKSKKIVFLAERNKRKKVVVNNKEIGNFDNTTRYLLLNDKIFFLGLENKALYKVVCK